MKRFVRLTGIFLIAAMLCGTLTGCKAFDYRKAQKLCDKGEYLEASALFSSLEDYKDSAEQAIAQIVFEHKSQQLVVWLSDGPAVFFVMAHCQTMALGNLLEAFVVVGIASAGVLDAIDMAVVMHHLVKQRRTDIFNGSCERSSSDVYFIAASRDRYPSVISHREVSICSWRGLNSDGRS